MSGELAIGKTVLIVEDEANLAELLTDILHAEGYEVVLSTASRAASRVEEVEPVAVVIDYVMPGMNGAEVAAQIRSYSGRQSPPVVLVSGLSNVHDLAIQANADAYLRKPFDLDAFIGVVGRLASPNP